MKTKMKKLMKNQKGMTLIELLAVIVIIAIIALIAIPAIGNIINNSKDKAILSDASNIISGAKIAFQDNACGSDDICDNTEMGKYVETEKTGTYKVFKTESGGTVTYSVAYSLFDNLKDTTGYATAISAATATEAGNALSNSKLSAYLDGTKDKASNN